MSASRSSTRPKAIAYAWWNKFVISNTIGMRYGSSKAEFSIRSKPPPNGSASMPPTFRNSAASAAWNRNSRSMIPGNVERIWQTEIRRIDFIAAAPIRRLAAPPPICLRRVIRCGKSAVRRSAHNFGIAADTITYIGQTDNNENSSPVNQINDRTRGWRNIPSAGHAGHLPLQYFGARLPAADEPMVAMITPAIITDIRGAQLIARPPPYPQYNASAMRSVLRITASSPKHWVSGTISIHKQLVPYTVGYSQCICRSPQSDCSRAAPLFATPIGRVLGMGRFVETQ